MWFFAFSVLQGYFPAPLNGSKAWQAVILAWCGVVVETLSDSQPLPMSPQIAATGGTGLTHLILSLIDLDEANEVHIL